MNAPTVRTLSRPTATVSAMSGSSAITMGFVGDVFLGRSIWNLTRMQGPGAPFAATRPLLDGLDLAVGNLEFSIVDGGLQEKKGRLVVLASDAEALKHSGIGIFSLANNHVMDAGARGLRATIAFLHDAGLGFFGAGETLEEAERPLIVRRKGHRIAFLGACDASRYHASRNRAGVAPMVGRRLVRRVAEARRQAEMVVVVLHADLEFRFHPAPFRQRLSRRLIDAGAAMVIQHHPHVVQGIEAYRGGLIAYSLGNYVFQVKGNRYQESRPGTSESLVLTVRANLEDGAARLESEAVPLRIDKRGCPVPCDPAESERRLRAMNRMSEQLLDPPTLRRLRLDACRTELKESLLSTYYMLHRNGAAAALRRGAMLFERQNWPWWIGLLSGGRY